MSEPPLEGEEIWADENDEFASKMEATPQAAYIPLSPIESLDNSFRLSPDVESPAHASGRSKVTQIRRAPGMSDTHGEIYTVLLQKSPNTGLGLNIAGGLGTTFGAVFIAKIFPGTPADLCGTMAVGDRLLKVHHEPTLHMTQQDVVNALKGLKTGTVELELMRIGDKQWSKIQREAGIIELRFSEQVKEGSSPDKTRSNSKAADPIRRSASARSVSPRVRQTSASLSPPTVSGRAESIKESVSEQLQRVRGSRSPQSSTPTKQLRDSPVHSPHRVSSPARPTMARSAASGKQLPEPPSAAPRLAARTQTPYQALDGGSSSSSLASDIVAKKTVPRSSRKLPAPPRKQAV